MQHINFLRSLLKDSTDILGGIRLATGGLSIDVAYGIKVSDGNDPHLLAADEAMRALSLVITPGSFWVETLPLLKHLPTWFPGAGFRRQGACWQQTTAAVVETPFNEVKTAMMTDTAEPSFTLNSLKRFENLQHQEKERAEQVIRNCAGVIHAAGGDTTAAEIAWFILGILNNPQAQYAAQEELDHVLGHGTLPTFADQPMLPHVTAIVKETLRWGAITPLAVPHYTDTQDEYQGYLIPAHSLVIGNAWAILHDEKIYQEAHQFKPERFLRNGQINPDIMDPDIAAWGFGRRVCPGMHMAKGTMWISIASILASFNIEKAHDEYGNTIEPSFECTPGIVRGPLPFQCTITPRSSQTTEAILATE
ncbi:Cytochrome P450 [Mycena chlorophos]|uniref:Cytochrome P450 n=1 Tax=Mycena chlorophos TaxID=658473 RepID=A0A8H6SB92_MYCCL|nr:Cytochrome P450 [Mycena chlorophos]